MTRHQWLGTRRWLPFRSEVVICQGISEFRYGELVCMCKALRTKCQCYLECKSNDLFYDDSFIICHVTVMIGRGCCSVTGRTVRTVTLHWAPSLINVGQTDIASSLIDLILKLHREKSYSDSYDHGFTDRRLQTQPEGEQFLVVWLSKLS
jgi:hypothetical protein